MLRTNEGGEGQLSGGTDGTAAGSLPLGVLCLCVADATSIPVGGGLAPGVLDVAALGRDGLAYLAGDNNRIRLPTRLQYPRRLVDGTRTVPLGGGEVWDIFAARSRALRVEALEHGWYPGILGPLMSGSDPDAPTLF